MPVNKELLEILCCPKTHVPVRTVTPVELREINAKIENGGLAYADGSAIEKPLVEALITEDGRTVYRIDDDIPIMLPEKGIPLAE